MHTRLTFLLLCLLAAATLPMSVNAQKRAYRAPEFAYDWGKPGLHPDHIVLNLTEDPSTSMSVTWRTSVDVQVGYAEIAIATAAPKFWRNAKTHKASTEILEAAEIPRAEVVSKYHSVTFTDLLPDTTYAYRVGNGRIWSEWIHFRTAPVGDKPFSFLYVGDTQNYIMELWSRLIRAGYQKAPEAGFIVHAGDLVNYAHDEGEWHEWFMAGSFIHRMLPSASTPGNHEYYPRTEEERARDIRSLSIQWEPGFTLPDNGPAGLKETVYYLDYGSMRLISLNSNVQQAEQVAWLEETLANNPQKWTVVTYHHPMYSASSGRNNEELRALWKPILDKYQVDLVIQGHDHSYARGRTEPDKNLLAGLNMRDQYAGTAYVVSVSGGKMYNMRPDGWDDYEGATRDRGAENTQLFQVISIAGDRLSFEAYTATGQLYDAFDLEKTQDGKPNRFIERQEEAIPVRTHDNTISYYDQLPDGVPEKLEADYPGYRVIRVIYYDEPEFRGYRVLLSNGEQRINLRTDPAGKILE